MTWLFPLYLLGALAVIGPILMHLRRRPPQDRVEFSSLMFLDSQVPQPVSRRRLEHWLLLLLRCLALLLLALMFSRPLWFREDVAADAHGQATIILMDRSASMRRGDLWAQAIAEAKKCMAEAKSERVALATFDRTLHPLWTFTEDQDSPSARIATLDQRFAEQKVGWSGTHLGQALVDAAAWFSQDPKMTGLKKRIVVISDFQEGSRLEALRSVVWPETVTVEIQRLEIPNGENNLSLSLAATQRETNESLEEKSDEKKRSGLRVRVGSSSLVKTTDYTLSWSKDAGSSVTGNLPFGGSRVLTPPPLADEKSARVLTLTGDSWDFDNRVFFAPLQPQELQTVFIGSKQDLNVAASPLYYLSRALQPTPSLAPKLEVIAPDSVTLPENTQVVFVSGAVLGDPLLNALHQLIQDGGMVLSVVDGEATAKNLAVLTGLKAEEIEVETKPTSQEYLMLAEVNTAHPLMTAFADERLRDFTKLRFWKHRSLSFNGEAAQKIQVLARFDNQSPAIVNVPVGKGNLILMTSGWHPADSQLALSTKFVPLLYSFLSVHHKHSGENGALWVGDSLPLQSVTSVTTPEGKTLSVKPGETLVADEVGFYKLQSEGTRTLAVNLPPEESRLAALDSEKLKELGVKVESSGTSQELSVAAVERETLAISEQEGQQRAWFWFLAAILGILGLETWLAGRIREGRPQPA